MSASRRQYVLLHKPRGVITAKQRCATNPALPTVTEVLIAGGLSTAADLSPVGRLDAESEGLLLLTDDGWLNHCMTHPSYGCRKTYLAVAQGRGRPGHRRRMRPGWCKRCVDEGIILRPSSAPPYTAQPAAMVMMPYANADAALGGGLGHCLDGLVGEDSATADEGDGDCCEGDDGTAGECRAECESDRADTASTVSATGAAAELDFVSVTMTEGKKHEVRHILRSGGFATLRLVRTAHGPLTDASLLARPPGSWRVLTPEEVAALGELRGMEGAAARRDGRARGGGADGVAGAVEASGGESSASAPASAPASSCAAGAEPPTVLAVVPRGFGVLYSKALHGGAPPPSMRLPNGSACQGGVIAGADGGGGEAGVDLVPVTDPSALERLLRCSSSPSVSAASCPATRRITEGGEGAEDCGAGGVPLIAVMALVGLAERDLGSLTHVAHHSDAWGGALQLLAKWRAPLPTATAAANSDGGGRVVVRFRGTALRDASSSAHGGGGHGGEAPPRSAQIAAAVAAGAQRRHGWTAEMVCFDLEVCALWLPSCIVVALPLTPGWVASNPKRFFPAEAEQSSGGRGTGADETQLRRSVCHGLLLAADVRPGELLLDPLAGSGTIGTEATSCFGVGLALSGDLARSAACRAGRAARARSGRGTRLDACRWDVAALPLRAGCADVVISDLPWGNRHKMPPTLLPDALTAIARALVPRHGRAVLLMTRVAAARVPLCAPSTLLLESTLDVVIGGFPAAVVKLCRTAELVANSAAAGADAKLEASGGGIEGGGEGGESNGVCCAVVVDAPLSQLTLSELLQRVWPRHVPSQSAAKRAVRHGRVCVAEQPTRNLFWKGAVPCGERVVLRPIAAQRMQPAEEAVLLARAVGLLVGADDGGGSVVEAKALLWEDARWLCLRKPPGLPVLSGRRSLANALRGLQLARRDNDRDQGGGTEAWTVAYDGDARVGGAWLIAKGAAGALALLDAEEVAMLQWRCIVKGHITTEQLSTMHHQLLQPEVLRVQASVRYGAVSEVCFSLPAAAIDRWQAAAAARGIEVVGGVKPSGRPRTVQDGPRAACVWVSSVHVVDAQSGRRVSGGDDSGGGGDTAPLPPPARFGKLLDMEEAVCVRLADEQQAAELARDLLIEAGDCDEEQGEEDASDVDVAESDGASDGDD